MSLLVSCGSCGVGSFPDVLDVFAGEVVSLLVSCGSCGLRNGTLCSGKFCKICYYRAFYWEVELTDQHPPSTLE